MTSILGIDPGGSGGFALLHADTRADAVVAWKMPETEPEIVDSVVALSGPVYCYLERVGPMPGQAARAMFAFGRNYGLLRAALRAAKIPFEDVSPARWQKDLRIPPRRKTESKTDHKRKLRARAQELFPDLRITNATADALLIATWGARQVRVTA